MSKKVFDQIAAGLREALAIARGEMKPARLYVPSEFKTEMKTMNKSDAKKLETNMKHRATEYGRLAANPFYSKGVRQQAEHAHKVASKLVKRYGEIARGGE